jgi:hypothetical protein
MKNNKEGVRGNLGSLVKKNRIEKIDFIKTINLEDNFGHHVVKARRNSS